MFITNLGKVSDFTSFAFFLSLWMRAKSMLSLQSLCHIYCCLLGNLVFVLKISNYQCHWIDRWWKHAFIENKYLKQCLPIWIMCNEQYFTMWKENTSSQHSGRRKESIIMKKIADHRYNDTCQRFWSPFLLPLHQETPLLRPGKNTEKDRYFNSIKQWQ